MKIKVNGKEEVFQQATLTVADLLKISRVQQPDMVSVQLNGEFVNRAAYPTTRVNEADEIDFLYFMGGGGIHGLHNS